MNPILPCRSTWKLFQIVSNRYLTCSTTLLSRDIIDPPEELELVPQRWLRTGEELHVKKARLLYQSRKRGMLENGLILSTFAHKYLNNFNEKQTDEYDKIINLPSNDWDLFNWAMGKKPTPPEFENGVMKMLRDHVQKGHQADCIDQPELYDSK